MRKKSNQAETKNETFHLKRNHLRSMILILAGFAMGKLSNEQEIEGSDLATKSVLKY